MSECCERNGNDYRVATKIFSKITYFHVSLIFFTKMKALSEDFIIWFSSVKIFAQFGILDFENVPFSKLVRYVPMFSRKKMLNFLKPITSAFHPKI